MVIFAGGKVRENVGKIISFEGNFHDTTPISLIKSCMSYFARGKFSRRMLYREKRDNYPHAKISTFTEFIFQNEGGLYCHMQVVYRLKLNIR